MSLEVPLSLPEDSVPPAAFSAVYRSTWDTISSHRIMHHDESQFPYADFSTLAEELQQQRIDRPLVTHDVTYHLAGITVELAPFLAMTKEDLDQMPYEAFQDIARHVRCTATGHIHDILAAYDDGVSMSEMQSLDGILHELTPLALYSRGDTLLLPASPEDDRYHKTDLHAYRRTTAGIRHERVQCKRNKIYTPPLRDIVLIDAFDYGNRIHATSRSGRLHNTSHLLVEAKAGNQDAEEAIERIGSAFWKIADFRLSTKFYQSHNELSQKRRLDFRFFQRITPDMIPNIEFGE